MRGVFGGGAHCFCEAEEQTDPIEIQRLKPEVDSPIAAAILLLLLID